MLRLAAETKTGGWEGGRGGVSRTPRTLPAAEGIADSPRRFPAGPGGAAAPSGPAGCRWAESAATVALSRGSVGEEPRGGEELLKSRPKCFGSGEAEEQS